MLGDAVRGRFDLLATGAVDRLGRSLQDLVATPGEPRAAGVDLARHRQALDTSTASGRALFGMLGVFAEFERAIIIERIKAGMARAKEQGKRLSRPLTPEEIRERIQELRANGHSLRWIAEEVGVSKSTVGNYANSSPQKARRSRPKKGSTKP